MMTPTPGPLKHPRTAGFMSANTVLPLYDVLGMHKGIQERDRIYQEAGMRFLPGPEDHVRERQVSKIHQAIRRDFPQDAKDIMEEAAIVSADIVAEYRIPASGKMMLRRLPWPLATWMMVRAAQQNAWTFSGSGTFTADSTAKVQLKGNPITRNEVSDDPVCHYHRALFQRLFQVLVHPRMVCIEHQCEAAGGDCCQFELTVPEDTPGA